MRRLIYGALTICATASWFVNSSSSQADDNNGNNNSTAADINLCRSMPVEKSLDLPKLAAIAVSQNADDANAALISLRSAGKEGLEAFVAAHKASIDKHLAEGAVNSAEPEWQRIKAALDSIAGQRDCYASKLFWYTDLEKAKAAAKESGKPILSLRLLGKLTDEFSCANSRFFRTTLYANEEVSKALRDRYILHWQSVRPVPKVTIDFGDGRKLERTLTGNSIHYILDSDGRVIDALPGLYGPNAFLRGLWDAHNAFAAVKTLDETKRTEFLIAYHEGHALAAQKQWQRDLEKLGLVTAIDVQQGTLSQEESKDAIPQPVAVKAMLIAAPKGKVEQPMMAAALPASIVSAPVAVAANRASQSKFDVESPLLAGALADANILAAKTDDAVWGRIAELHQDDAQLDAASQAFIRAKNPNAGRAGAVAVTKAFVENPMVRLVRNFQNTIAIDTVRNEYTLHRQIHEWFAKGSVPLDLNVNELNERVYAQLFLTPSSDPWLGLMPGDVYTALENNGVAKQ